ncbi:MAG: hypothetical protein Q4B68_07465 [Bacteroidales bacterium]|nr:hypothetical protein [Bacteroidales bacterium]
MKQLKHRILFLLILVAFFAFTAKAFDNDEALLNYYGQQYTYINTPFGKPILVYINNELTPAEKSQITHDCITLFPNVVILDQPSALYNCHNYAWHMTEGYLTDKYWMDAVKPMTQTANLSKFWSNDAFEVTTAAIYDKIVYYSSSSTLDSNITHSAVASNVSGYYESKWGAWPLVRHLPDDVPVGYGTTKIYFKPIAPTPLGGVMTCSNGYGTISVNTSANYMTSVSSAILAKTTRIYYHIESPKGGDAVEEGSATINSRNNYGFNVTFTRQGIYEMTVKYYNKYNELLASYSYEPIVSL